jgi:hypothetical protein
MQVFKSNTSKTGLHSYNVFILKVEKRREHLSVPPFPITTITCLRSIYFTFYQTLYM